MTKRSRLCDRAIFLGIVGLSTLAACGGGEATGGSVKAPVVREEAPDAASAKRSKAVASDAEDQAAPGREAASGSAAPAPRAADVPLPGKVASLFEFVGKDAPVIVNIPRPDKILASIDAGTRDALLKEILDEASKKSPADAAVVRGLVEGFDGAVVFSDPRGKAVGDEAMVNAACFAARFRDPKPVEALLADKSIERNGPRFTIKGGGGDTPHGVWLADSGVLMSCMTREALSDALSVAGGSARSYAASSLFKPERAGDLFVSIDVQKTIGEGAEPGSRFIASLTTQGQKLALDMRLTLLGPTFPAVGSIIDAAPQALVAKMPKGAVGVVGMSLKRMAGKDLVSALKLIDQQTHGSSLSEAEGLASSLGVSLTDVNAALGDEIAVGLYRDPKFKIDFEKTENMDHMAAVVVVATKDEAAQKKLWSVFEAIAKKKPKEASVKGNSVEIHGDSKSKDKEVVRVESRVGFIAIGVGDKAIVTSTLARLGKAPEALGASASFSEARAREKPSEHLLAYVDGAVLSALFENKNGPVKMPKITAGPAFFSMIFGPTERGIDVTLGGGGVSEILGIMSTIAVAGAKAYLDEVKSATPATPPKPPRPRLKAASPGSAP